MNRRSFLIGSESIVTAAFVDKANWFLRNENAVVPFAEVDEAAQKLYFVNQGYGPYDLSLGTPDCAFPKLTYLEWLSEYEKFDLEKGRRISLESFENSGKMVTRYLINWSQLQNQFFMKGNG